MTLTITDLFCGAGGSSGVKAIAVALAATAADRPSLGYIGWLDVFYDVDPTTDRSTHS